MLCNCHADNGTAHNILIKNQLLYWKISHERIVCAAHRSVQYGAVQCTKGKGKKIINQPVYDTYTCKFPYEKWIKIN